MQRNTVPVGAGFAKLSMTNYSIICSILLWNHDLGKAELEQTVLLSETDPEIARLRYRTKTVFSLTKPSVNYIRL